MLSGTCVNKVLLALLSFLICALAVPAVALGADTVYWSSREGTIGFANLDGSGGANLNISGAPVSEAAGVAIDSATGRIYWANRGGSIGFANLDGSGGGTLDTRGAALSFPEGLAIDPVGRRLYWSDRGNDTVSFASLDGGGGGTLTISGARVEDPGGLVVDPVARRLYWGNTKVNAPSISFANLDGSGGGTIPIGGGAVRNPTGIALDSAAQRIYWTNFDGPIFSANLNGSDVSAVASPLSSAIGIAVDSEQGRIFWGDFRENQIGFGSLDNTGRDRINTGSGSVEFPFFVALLKAPRAVEPPTVFRSAAQASLLACGLGSWAPDLPGSFLFRAPHTLAFEWIRNGKVVQGAKQSSLMADARGGDYQCRVTAQNHAGSTSQTSSPLHIAALAFDRRRTKVTLTLASRRIGGSGPIRVRAANANAFPVRGSLSGSAGSSAGSKSKPGIRFGKSRLVLPAHARRIVKLRLPHPLRVSLARKAKLEIALAAKIIDPAGNRRTIRKLVLVRLRRS